jgi:hypothetical protein
MSVDPTGTATRVQARCGAAQRKGLAAELNAQRKKQKAVPAHWIRSDPWFGWPPQ